MTERHIDAGLAGRVIGLVMDAEARGSTGEIVRPNPLIRRGIGEMLRIERESREDGVLSSFLRQVNAQFTTFNGDNACRQQMGVSKAGMVLEELAAVVEAASPGYLKAAFGSGWTAKAPSKAWEVEAALLAGAVMRHVFKGAKEGDIDFASASRLASQARPFIVEGPVSQVRLSLARKMDRHGGAGGR